VRIIRPQLLRAGTGVATNNRAAGRSRSGKDFIAKVGVVVEEADESEFWLDVLQTRGYEPAGPIKTLRAEAAELVAIFVSSRQTAIQTQERKRAEARARRSAKRP
jgi:four helix bundle protein